MPDALPADRPAPAPPPPLARAQLHEIHAGTAHWPAALAFALAAAGRRGAIVLARERGGLAAQIHGAGLLGLGLDPGRLVLVEARDQTALLRAGHDAARCPGLALVVIESWGRLATYDLTASRRLVLAAEQSQVPLVLLRGDAPPRPSAAHTRWAIRAAPSVALAADAPGHAMIEAELLRCRGGAAGRRWVLEWNGQDGCFRSRDGDAGQRPTPRAPLPGAVVPLVPLRAGATSRAA